MGFRILGTGTALPERVVTNDDLSEFLDTSDEWISQRTGIKTRHVCTTDSLDDLATRAAEEALSYAGVDASELDLIVCSTTSPDHIVPAQATAVGERIGAACPSFDVAAACAGFIFALDVADGWFARGRARRVLVMAHRQLCLATVAKDLFRFTYLQNLILRCLRCQVFLDQVLSMSRSHDPAHSLCMVEKCLSMV